MSHWLISRCRAPSNSCCSLRCAADLLKIGAKRAKASTVLAMPCALPDRATARSCSGPSSCCNAAGLTARRVRMNSSLSAQAVLATCCGAAAASTAGCTRACSSRPACSAVGGRRSLAHAHSVLAPCCAHPAGSSLLRAVAPCTTQPACQPTGAGRVDPACPRPTARWQVTVCQPPSSARATCCPATAAAGALHLTRRQAAWPAW
jgi:hypothetical protein